MHLGSEHPKSIMNSSTHAGSFFPLCYLGLLPKTCSDSFVPLDPMILINPLLACSVLIFCRMLSHPPLGQIGTEDPVGVQYMFLEPLAQGRALLLSCGTFAPLCHCNREGTKAQTLRMNPEGTVRAGWDWREV
jgi:hypothetical protein